MKYIKTFENQEFDDKLLKDFYYDYESVKNLRWFSDLVKNRIKTCDIPEFLQDEFSILYFFYAQRYLWAGYDREIYKYKKNDVEYKKINNYIKRNIKKKVLNSTLKKIEDDLINCQILKNFININKDFSFVGDVSIKYIMLLFEDIYEDVPEWIKKSNKYNL